MTGDERQAAQHAAAELARMGIDPTSLGLEAAPVQPPASPARVRGVATVPSNDNREHLMTLFIKRPLTGSPPTAAPGRITKPLEDATETRRVLLPARWHRTARAATLGLWQPGAAAAIEHERQLVARVRTPRREPAIVVFLSGKGGSGTTSTAAGIGLTLATVRTDNVAIVDARRGTTSLGRRLAGKPAPNVAQLSEPEDAPPRHLLPLRARGLLGVVDAPPWHSRLAHTRVLHVLDRLRETHALTLADVGTDLEPAGQAVLGRADQVVLVTTTSRDAIDATRIALGRIWEEAPHRLNTLIVAVACLTSRQYRRTLRHLHTELGLTSRIVAVPWDPALAAGDPMDPDTLRPATREAFLRLAGLVADPGPPDRDLQPGTL
ncbi:MAG TPA: hypothetical protein VF062_11775 [Candidatus Limnocylindrales bacterium]